MKKKRNYDKKVKLTRILLADYLALKALSQKAGISMAEALHKLIAQQPLPKPVTVTPRIQIPMLVGATAYQTRPQIAIATNGSAAAFRIKPKEVRYE